MNPEICPLCGLGSHPGKCERPSRGLWWCGLCLHEKLPAAPATAPQANGSHPEEELIPPAILLAAGARRTRTWCHRCGIPLCDLHSKWEHCAEECRRRLPATIERIESLIERYSPEYLEHGPSRCTVCLAPSWRRKLCARHYRHFRQGRSQLKPERQYVPRGEEFKVVSAGVYLTPDTLRYAKYVADFEGKTLSRWAAELIEDAVEKKTGLKMKRAYFVGLPNGLNKKPPRGPNQE